MSQPDSTAEEPEDPPVDSEAAESEEAKPETLSAEEQMEAYEESLKDTDWGHQPC